MNNEQKQASNHMMQFITAKWISKPIYVATKLGIADILEEGAKTIDEIAEITKSHSPYLYRIMRALAGFGIFSEDDEKRFQLTPFAECLQKDKMAPMVLMFLSDWHNKAWDNLLYSVQTGKIAFEKAHGEPCFEWFKSNPDAAEVFNSANSLKAAATHSIILQSYDFSMFKKVADIGGGYGGLMIEILKAYPSMEGIIADTSLVIEKTKNILKINNLDQRCNVEDCDFFKEISKGNDAYILSHILHDWDDERSKIILDNCYRAMGSESKLLIVEMIVPSLNVMSISKLLDLEVLVMGGGCERTEEEYKSLLDQSGFVINRIIPTEENISLIECTIK